METSIAKNIISQLKEESKKCKSIQDFLDLSYSFKFDNTSIMPFQIMNEFNTLLKVLAKEKPKILLEIGTANGGTLFLFSKISPKVGTILSIDMPGGRFGGEFFPDWKISLYESFASGEQKIKILRSNSHDVTTLQNVKKLLQGREIDFLFIDGDHTYDGVKKDFEMYSKLLAKEGIIAFHDICNGPSEDVGEVPKFWEKIKNEHTSIEIIDNDNLTGYGIGLLLLNQDTKNNSKYIDILKTVYESQNSLIIKKNLEQTKITLPFRKKIDQEIQKRVSLQKEFDDRTKWALELDSELQKLQSELSTKDSEIQQLQSNLHTVNTELSDIKNSILFKLPFKVARGLDKFFPSSTKRGEALRLARSAVQTAQTEGSGVLAQATAEKLRRQRVLKKKRSLPKTLEFEVPASLDTMEITKNSKIISSEKTPVPDLKFRQYISLDSQNILKLSKFPKVSIIIPTCNQVDYLKKNLFSIENKSTYKNYEIIIVTNNLDENSEMRKFLKTLKHHFYVYDGKYSFSGVNNFAAKKASGDYLLFLNDDVEVITPNWLEAMLKLAQQDKVGAVGSKLLFTDGRLQEAGCIAWKDGILWNYGRNQNPNDSNYNFVRNVDYCSASCLMIKKELFEKLGGFDEGYEPAYCEDADFCLSLQRSGYQVLYQPQSILIHHEGKTSGTDLKSGIKSYQIQNQKRFRKKWQKFLDSRLNDSMDNINLERNRRPGKNILYIDHYVPEYDKDAGSLLEYYVLSILSYLGHKVTFWPEKLIKNEPYTTDLQQKAIEVIYGHHNFKSFIKKRGKEFHACFLTRAHVAPNFIDLVKKYAPQTKIFYDTVDLHFVREFREAKLKDDYDIFENAKKTREIELELFQKSDVVIVKTKEEANYLLKENTDLKFALIPTFEITPQEFLSFAERKDLLFVGGFQHPPNIDSIEYTIKNIFPKIKQKLPNVKLYVVGSNAPRHVKELCLKTEGVVFLGYVKDIHKYLKECRILVAPIRYGAGIKGKITQSMAYGLTVITTHLGAEGIGKEDDKIMMIANNEDDFAAKTFEVYTNEDLWTKLSTNARKHVENNFSPEKIRNTLIQILS